VGRPGTLTRSYIDGKRARYLSPLATFLLCYFFMFLVFSTVPKPETLNLSDRNSAAENVSTQRENLREAQSRLQEASAERERNLATVDALLVSPAGSAAMERVGVSQERVRGALPTLSDAELRDLATRAAALQADPTAAGLTTKQWIWIGVAVVAIVVIIIVAS